MIKKRNECRLFKHFARHVECYMLHLISISRDIYARAHETIKKMLQVSRSPQRESLDCRSAKSVGGQTLPRSH